MSLQVQPRGKACLLCSLQGEGLNLHSRKHSLSLLCSDPDKCHQRGICDGRLWNAQLLSSIEEKLTPTPASGPHMEVKMSTDLTFRDTRNAIQNNCINDYINKQIFLVSRREDDKTKANQRSNQS